MTNKLILLLETIESKPISVQNEGLPKGILARVVYPIMEFGIRNANQRVYDRKVAENVLKDPDVNQKLQEKNLFGDSEHPEYTSIKLHPHTTSHYISRMWIDEDRNQLLGEFDILPTIGGKFIHVLLEAGCLVGTSSRAEGELEEAIDEKKQKYYKVVPNSYRFVCADFTGDRSTKASLPENYVSTVKNQYEAKRLQNEDVLALLENVKTTEAMSLRESIQKESTKDEVAAINKDAEKIKKIKDELADELKNEGKLTIGRLVKINDGRVAILNQVFEKTNKAIVQIGIERIALPLSECKAVFTIEEAEEKEWLQLEGEQIEKYKQYRAEGLSHPDAINKAKKRREMEEDASGLLNASKKNEAVNFDTIAKAGTDTTDGAKRTVHWGKEAPTHEFVISYRNAEGIHKTELFQEKGEADARAAELGLSPEAVKIYKMKESFEQSLLKKYGLNEEMIQLDGEGDLTDVFLTSDYTIHGHLQDQDQENKEAFEETPEEKSQRQRGEGDHDKNLGKLPVEMEKGAEPDKIDDDNKSAEVQADDNAKVEEKQVKEFTGKLNEAEAFEFEESWSVAELGRKAVKLHSSELDDTFAYLNDREVKQYIANDIQKYYGCKVTSVRLVDTDSGNIGHANAYYLIKVTGNLIKVKKAFPPMDESIKQVGSEYEVVSHKGKNLGKFKTRAEAVRRLKQVEYFKVQKESKKVFEDTKAILGRSVVEIISISEDKAKVKIGNDIQEAKLVNLKLFNELPKIIYGQITKENISKLMNVDNLSEARGEKVVQKAIAKAHEGNVLGVFWYDLHSKQLDYKPGRTDHAKFEKYVEYQSKDGMVRGRLVKDNDGTNFILVYTQDFENNYISGEAIDDIYTKVSNIANVSINHVVDDSGYDLVEMNLHLLDEAIASDGFSKDEEPNENDRDDSPYHKLYKQSQEKDNMNESTLGDLIKEMKEARAEWECTKCGEQLTFVNGLKTGKLRCPHCGGEVRNLEEALMKKFGLVEMNLNEGTNALIGVVNKDNSVDVIWLRYDGYDAGKILSKYYNSEALARQLISLGDLEILGPSLKKVIDFKTYRRNSDEYMDAGYTVVTGRKARRYRSEREIGGDNDYGEFLCLFKKGRWTVINLSEGDTSSMTEVQPVVNDLKEKDKKYLCPSCKTDVTGDEGHTCPKCGKVYWDDEKGIHPIEEGDKVGQKVSGKINGKERTGTIKSIDKDMAQVDFGNGDVYGIALRRISGSTIKEDGNSEGPVEDAESYANVDDDQVELGPEFSEDAECKISNYETLEELYDAVIEQVPTLKEFAKEEVLKGLGVEQKHIDLILSLSGEEVNA
jgi:predicted RNA-binding Zn-ribbon protein involved in translation (DUF1610 family)